MESQLLFPGLKNLFRWLVFLFKKSLKKLVKIMSKILPLGSVIRNSNLTSKYPLLILLHGYGSNENDLFTFANEMPKELLIISLRAPHKINPYGYAWYAINFDANQKKWNNLEQAKDAMKSINKCIETACSLYSINNSNISILGFSQGCILSLALALNLPKKIQKYYWS